MRPSFKSFSLKWTFAFVGVFLLVFLSTVFFILRQIGREEIRQVRIFLTEEAVFASKMIQPLLQENSGGAKIQDLLQNLGRNEGPRITVISPDGTALDDNYQTAEEVPQMDNHLARPEVADALKYGSGTSIRSSLTVHKEMLYVALAVRDAQRLLGVVRVSMPMSVIEQRMAAVHRPIWAGAAAGIVLILTGGFALGLWMSGNMRRMTMAALQYTRGDFSQKIAIDSDDELRILADSMNHMAASLKERIRDAEEEKQRLGTILENMTEGVLAVDGDGQIVVINSKAALLFGVSKENAQGRNFLEVVLNHRLYEMIEKAVAENAAVSGEIEIHQPAPRILKVNAVGTRPGAEGRLGIAVLHDVTQIRRLERLRRDFVANVSHELKTPITTIKGFIETLLGGALKDRAQSERFLSMMAEDVQRLHRLVQDLLELSRIESGEAVLKRTGCDVAAEADKAFEKLALLAGEHGVRLENKIDRTRTPAVSADRDKLAQVFINLIENAIKFNKPGGAVSVEAAQSSGKINVTVRDSGIGIPERSLPRIFERFYRVDVSRSRELGGTGLGLAIVKHILEAHGGTIACTSRPGEGSAFTFTLAASG